MMKLRTVLVAGLLLVAAGMGSAQLLEAYGSITGDAVVDGPVLYADEDNMLVFNDAPNNHTTYSFDGDDARMFESDTFDARDFDYTPVADVTVQASTNESDDGQLNTTFGYRSDGTDHYICSVDVAVDTATTTYTDTCSADGSLTGVEQFYIMVAGANDDSDTRYHVTVGSSNGYTRVEVSDQ